MEILDSKKYKDYDRVSRYSAFPYYHNRLDDKYIYGITAQLSQKTKCVSHKVVSGDTLDNLALYYYNNPTYYWIIADVNRISDPYLPLELGRILKIPTFSCIEYDL